MPLLLSVSNNWVWVLVAPVNAETEAFRRLLFLFGIMITRAPLGKNAELDNDKNKKLGAAISGSIFLLFSYILINNFDGEVNIASGSSTELLGEILLTRFIFPFELVSFVLLAALIGGITLARKDEALIDKDQV